MASRKYITIEFENYYSPEDYSSVKSVELDLFNLVEYYKENYDRFVKEDFPYNKYVDMAESYYNKGIDYLSNFGGLPGDYEVLGVEREIHINIGGRDLIGYVDLIVREKASGDIIIVDHKSAKKLAGEQLEAYLNQIYLYSLFIRNEYGVFPKKLVFNLIKSSTIQQYDFDSTRLEEAVSWFCNTVDKAENTQEFNDAIELSGIDLESFKRNNWYCNNLCSARAHCIRSCYYEGGDIDWL